MALYAISTDLDINSHGGGALLATQVKVFINNFRVCLPSDPAPPDSRCNPENPSHCAPNAVPLGSTKVFIGGILGVHRHGDSRVCGATTVSGNTKVFAG